MGGNISVRVLARVVVGVALALTMAACGLGAPDAQGPGGPPDAPVLDLAAIRTLEVGAHREIGVTETGLYTVTEDAVVGFAPDGTRQWTLRKDGARPDTDRVRPVLFQPVLLVGWEGTPGLVAYSTETGEQLWSTAAEEWTQGDTADGTVTFADARTGTQAWSVSLASFGCPPTEDALVPVWIRDVVLIRCHTATGPDGKGADQWVAALDPRDGAVRWQRQLTGGDHVAVVAVADPVNDLAARHHPGGRLQLLRGRAVRGPDLDLLVHGVAHGDRRPGLRMGRESGCAGKGAQRPAQNPGLVGGTHWLFPCFDPPPPAQPVPAVWEGGNGM